MSYESSTAIQTCYHCFCGRVNTAGFSLCCKCGVQAGGSTSTVTLTSAIYAQAVDKFYEGALRLELLSKGQQP